VTDRPEAPARLLRVKTGAAVPLDAPVVRLGRDLACEVRVADRHVSRVHAEIRREGPAYILYDRSTNGTWVNGLRVRGRHLLADGDRIRVGGERFVFARGAPPESRPPEVSPTAGTVPVEVVGPPLAHSDSVQDALGDTLGAGADDLARAAARWPPVPSRALLRVGLLLLVAAGLFALGLWLVG
jgi:pSer/pThr/pTyr-binding forkhead associated (FHA) protein